MTRVDLPQRKSLIRPNEPIANCYFLETGVASVTSTSREGKQAEIGLIGSEGMIDVGVLLGSPTTPLEVFVQIPGSGHVVPSADLTALLADSPHARSVMLSFAHTLLVQVSQSLLATVTLTLDGRLSRWLLMSSDRSRSETFPMTHEFLSLMLGVRRAGVTDTLNRLVADGLISTRRGEITIVDRKGLERRAGESYDLQSRNLRALYA